MEGVVEAQQRLGLHFSTRDFTICVHDGPLAGQEVPHVHAHVIPRTPGDGGGTLMSMWPDVTSTEADYEALASLSEAMA